MISFVGAGPGAVDLLTVRAVERLAAADVVVWAASLVPEPVLDHCRPGVEVHDSKTMALDDVLAVFAAHPDAEIVRLHSGDPAVFSSISEQIAWCRSEGRIFEVVPGVSAMAAAAAAVGCELTVPGVAQTVTMTRLARRTKASMPADESLAASARVGGTLALHLTAGNADELTSELCREGSRFDSSTPVVLAHRVTWPDERVVRTTVGAMAAAMEEARMDATVMILVGPALAEADPPRRSHVYDATYTTRFRAGTPHA